MTSSSSRQYVSSFSAKRTLQARRIFFSCDKCDLFLCTVLHASFALRAYFRSHMRIFSSVFRVLHNPAECYETSALTYMWGFSPHTVFRSVLKLMTSNYISFCMSAHLCRLKTKYRGADRSLARPTSRCILFDGENISFDASLVICINSTNIPPIMIINRIYETQNLLSL